MRSFGSLVIRPPCPVCYVMRASKASAGKRKLCNASKQARAGNILSRDVYNVMKSSTSLPTLSCNNMQPGCQASHSM